MMKFLNRHVLLSLTLREKRVGSRMKPLTVFSYLGLALMGVVLVLAYLWIRMQVLKSGYEVDALRQKRDRLLNQNKQLEVAYMSKVSLSRVEKIARTMQFSVPPKERIYFIAEGPVKQERSTTK